LMSNNRYIELPIAVLVVLSLWCIRVRQQIIARKTLLL
jgi:hypothetical protein